MKFYIACALKENRFNPGEDIIKQGDKGDDFHIIIEGSCQVWKITEGKRIDLINLKKEAYFGELTLLFDRPRAATVTSDVVTKIVSLDIESFKLLLGPLTDILKRNTEMYQSYMKKGGSTPNIQKYTPLTPISEKKSKLLIGNNFLNFFNTNK